MKVHRNCCGLDVHKATIAACLIREEASGNTHKEKRLFGTMTQHLRELAQWLREAQVTAVAMEATGVYWVPVWNVLEGAGLHLVLINPQHYRAVRGKKTDLKDGERIAELLQGGRLEGSYVPPAELRVLRDLTRYRIKLVEHQCSIACRIQKLLEQCDIKLGSVASNVLGVSARTHPGVGPITALAFVLTLGQIERFAHSRQVVSYLGLNPAEHSGGGRQRLGSISKQGNPMLRSLLGEAGQSAARCVPELKRAYQRLKHRQHSAVAKVMVARKLAVRRYWMWKTQQPYAAARTQASPSHPVVAV